MTAVGKDMVRDARYFRLATRICAELGAQVVKTYYVAESFETVTASCPVPIVMAGGKKLPETRGPDDGVPRGAARGRPASTWAATSSSRTRPAAMIQAVAEVVHELMKPEQAHELYQTLKHEQREGRRRCLVAALTALQRGGADAQRRRADGRPARRSAPRSACSSRPASGSCTST